ncbi:MAG TPA: CDP-diacylglycerol--glycerol-3-phosphate 3-phosphatidyltransferase [Streptosporangiaceae bacterium]|jgi:CDP-diacylglycerol--glycerol-3-phosphate 3-phosphatidyltransferase
MTSPPDPAAVPSVPGGVPVKAPSLYNIANALTVARILLVPVFVWLLFADGTAWRVAALVVFVIASITDRLDGELARKRAIVTDFGKIADPIADKALTGSALVSLSILGELWWWVTIVILVREIGITLLRFMVIRHGVIPASKGGKVKTMLQVVAIGLYIMPGPIDPLRWAVMAAALVVTVATGADYVLRAWRLSRRAPAES